MSRSTLDCYDEDTEVVADQGEILIILTSTGGVSEGEFELAGDSEVGRMGMKPLFIWFPDFVFIKVTGHRRIRKNSLCFLSDFLLPIPA